MKLLLRILLVVVLLAVAAAVVAYLWIDTLAKKGIEEGGTYALGVPTKVQTVSVGLFGGTMELDGLNVANPQGFQTPHVMHSGKFDVEIIPSSLFGDVVQVRKFELDGLDINFEQKLPDSNIKLILDHIQKIAGGGEDKPEEPAGKGKKVQLDRIRIRNVTANFRLPVAGDLKVEVPEIVLDNVTSDNAQGVVLSELIQRLVPAIIAAVVEKAEGTVPADFLNNIEGQLGQTVQALGGQAQKLVGEARAEMEKAVQAGVEQAGKAVGDVGKNVSEQAGKATEDLQKGVGDAVNNALGGKRDANDANDGGKKPGLLDGLMK